jgi:hypothetical protein
MMRINASKCGREGFIVYYYTSHSFNFEDPQIMPSALITFKIVFDTGIGFESSTLKFSRSFEMN